VGVHSSPQQWEAAQPELAYSCKIVLRAWEQRLESQHSSAVQPLLQPAHVAAYMLDTLNSDTVSKNKVHVPKEPAGYEDMAHKLNKRLGSAVGGRHFSELPVGATVAA
jgi:hypothetical protein